MPTPRSELETSRSLIGRASNEEPGAWDVLVERYAPLVYGWCRRRYLQDQDVADVLQEVFRAVAVHLHRFDHHGHGGAFRGWLRVITTNKIRDLHRRQEREIRGEGGTVALRRLAAIPDPESLASSVTGAQSEDDRVVAAALERIRPRFLEVTWQCFWRTVVDERPATEVAEELGTTPGSVRVAKLRVLRRLRSLLEVPPEDSDDGER